MSVHNIQIKYLLLHLVRLPIFTKENDGIESYRPKHDERWFIDDTPVRQVDAVYYGDEGKYMINVTVDCVDDTQIEYWPDDIVKFEPHQIHLTPMLDYFD